MTQQQILQALTTVLCYGLMCGAIAWRHRLRQREAQQRVDALLPATPGAPVWWVAHASQTGQAEELALQTAQALHAAGVPVRLAPLGQIGLADLQQADRLLCIASTYGEGDAPDSAERFAREVMGSAGASLSHLHVGLLALGDKTYTHFCGFGRALDQWLASRGAQPLFERIDVDKSDPEALRRWRQHLARLAGTSDLPDWEAPPLQPWRLQAREHLNPGSEGEPVHHLKLVPEPGTALPDWQAGDLVQIEVPTAPGEPRDYSVASVPQDGAVHLLVRRCVRADGSPGLASGWLTQAAEPGASVMLRLRAHSGVRIGDNFYDHDFTDLTRDSDGLAHTYLTATDGRGFDIWQDESFKHTVIFTPDFYFANVGEAKRYACAIEPQTSGPNSFNTGDDLLWLKQGEMFSADWGVNLLTK